MGTIFERIARLFGRQPRDRYGRKIFRYFDGEKERGADPLRAHRAFLEHPTFDIAKHPYGVDAGDPTATRISVDAICDVFHVKRWDDETQTGLPEYEILDLFIQFYCYLDDLKKNTGLIPTSPPDTGLPPSPPPQDANTSDTSASVGTSSDSPSETAG